jgi:hypothetical protein
MIFQSTEQAADAILAILQDEASRLGADPKIENKERRARSNELRVSLKRDGKTFRITFDWVRDEHLADRSGFHLGNGYIETEWDLRLEPEVKQIPPAAPFHWRLIPRDESVPKASHPHTLEDAWLRRLIRKKLSVPQNS